MPCIANLAKNPWLGDLIGPSDEPTTIILLNGHSIKLLSPLSFTILCNIFFLNSTHFVVHKKDRQVSTDFKFIFLGVRLCHI